MAALMRDYGAMMIADPALSEENLTQLKGQFTEMVTKNGGQVTEVTAMGKRRMSFKIGKHSEGNYLQFKLQMPPAGVVELNRVSSALERVVRLVILSGDAFPEPPAPAAAKTDEKEA